MQVTLFIGHHKTGSTALQDYLSSNFLRLLRHGILYPPVESQGMATALAQALHRGRKLPQLNLPLNMREAHNALAFRMMADVDRKKFVPGFHKGLPHSTQMFTILRNQIEILAPKHVILCAESMSNFANWPVLISRLAELFAGAKLRIICTLRRPDDYLVSWHMQRLRFHAPLRSFAEGAFDTYRNSVHFDYRYMLAPWFEHMPDAELSLRSYRAVMATGGSVQDFRERSGIRFPRAMLPPLRRNYSLPFGTAETLRRGFRTLEAKDDKHVLLDLVQQQAGAMKLASNREIEMLGPDLRAHMAAEFAPIHDYLGDISGEVPFFDDIDQITALRPVSEDVASRQVLSALRPEVLDPGHPVRSFLEDLRQSKGLS